MKKTLNTLLTWTFGSFNAIAIVLFLFFQQNHDVEKAAGGCAVCGVGGIIVLVVILFYILCGWKVFVKAGKPGWASIIPIYNLIVFAEMTGRPAWWYIIPFLNLLLPFDLAKSFGKETGFAVGLLILSPIFYPMLAFGSAEYKGPSVAPTTPSI